MQIDFILFQRRVDFASQLFAAYFVTPRVFLAPPDMV